MPSQIITPAGEPSNAENKIHELYRKIAEFNFGCSCHIGVGKEASAFSFAAVQQIFGVFGFAATAELLSCSEVPDIYKITCLAVTSAALMLGTYQQWQKCRQKFIPGVYTSNVKEPEALPSYLAKLSAFFEVLSVASAGANFAQLFTTEISATGMACVKKYFWDLEQAIPRLGGALVALTLMGRQMWTYYHSDSKITYPWLVSAGYCFGSYASTAYPLVKDVVHRTGNLPENIYWLLSGFLIQIPKINMFTKQYKARGQALPDEESEPLLPVQRRSSSCSHCLGPYTKTLMALITTAVQTSFNARSLVSMVSSTFPEQAQLQLIFTVLVIILAVLGSLVTIGRYFIYS